MSVKGKLAAMTFDFASSKPSESACAKTERIIVREIGETSATMR
jgi:hypothetical protein